MKKSALAVGLLAIGIGISGCTDFNTQYTNGKLSEVEIVYYGFSDYSSYSVGFEDENLFCTTGFFRRICVSAHASIWSEHKGLLRCAVTVERGGVTTRLEGEARSLNAFIKAQKNFSDANLVLATLKKERELLKAQVKAKHPELGWK